MEDGKNWCFHVPLSVRARRRSSWLFSRRSQRGVEGRRCRVAPGNSVVAAGREAWRKEFLQFLCKQIICLYESFLVWVQKSFSGKAEAGVGILPGFL